jgi:ATP-dependent helicase/DNAse subunit B
VRQIAQNHADRIAIIYGDETQYLNQVQDELTSSKVQWHGKSRNMAQSSVLYRTLDLLLQALEDRTPQASGFDRPKLMRLIQNGSLHVDGIQIASDRVRKFVRRQEIYGDVLNWLSILDSLDREATDDKDTTAREHLGLLINTIETGLNHMQSSETWEMLGSRLLSLTRQFHESFEPEEGSIEERGWVELSRLLENEMRAIDDLAKANPELRIDIDSSNLLRLVRKRVGEARVRHGNLSTGIFVGSIQEAQALSFDTIYLLGATEGILPPNVNADPFLPSGLLHLVDEYGLAEWSKDNQPKILSRVLSPFLAAAKKVVILRPRGGTAGKLEDLPSRYLPEALNEQESADSKQIHQVSSLRASFDLELDGAKLGPISDYDQALSTAEVERNVDLAFQKSMKAWRNPAFDEYFGNLEVQAKVGPIWQRNHAIPLSSTRIDSYLQCPYKFFSGTILGLNDNDRSDFLDEFSATAFGTYFHQAMDKFIKDLAAQGQLPAAGESFPAESAQVFLSRYLEPSFNRFIATGKNGWNRSLEMHVTKLIRTLAVFFQTEAAHLRSELGLAVYSSEDSFGKGVLLPEHEATIEMKSWNVEIKDEEGEPHKIVGQVDRLDLSPDRKSVGVLDFKTGSRKTFVEKKLGILKTKQSDNVMTLQDVIYRAAALQRFGENVFVTVNFVFPTQPEDKMFVEAIYAHDPKGLLPKTLSKIKASGVTGNYPAQADAYCKPCEYLNNITDIIIRDQKTEKAQ